MGMTVQAVDAQSPTSCAPSVCIQEAPLVAPGVTSPAVPATFSIPLSSPVHRSRFGLIPGGRIRRNSEFTLSTGFSNFNNETETPALTTLRRMIPQLEISQSTKPHHDPKNYSLTHKGGYRLCCVQSSKKTPNIFTILHILAFALYICTLSLFLLSASVLYHVRISMSLIKCQSYFILASSLDIFLMSPKQQLEDSDITLSVPPWKCICAKWHNIWAKCSGKWKECKFAPNKPWIVDYVLI